MSVDMRMMDRGLHDEVHAFFLLWHEALESKDDPLGSVLALYDPDAILLATMDPTPLRTQAQRSVYFERLMARPHLRLSVQDLVIRPQGQDNAVADGLYTFHFLENGKDCDLQARFTFVYKKTKNGWRIISHHSSPLPEPV